MADGERPLFANNVDEAEYNQLAGYGAGMTYVE